MSIQSLLYRRQPKLSKFLSFRIKVRSYSYVLPYVLLSALRLTALIFRRGFVNADFRRSSDTEIAQIARPPSARATPTHPVAGRPKPAAKRHAREPGAEGVGDVEGRVIERGSKGLRVFGDVHEARLQNSREGRNRSR